MSDLALAAILAATILAASTISVEIGLSVALIELALGVVVGNVFARVTPDWLSFIGSFAGIVLTFLAGAEVDVAQFKREWKASLVLGGVSFAGPFAASRPASTERSSASALMSATFVTDFGTAAALSILFIKPTVWILPSLPPRPAP